MPHCSKEELWAGNQNQPSKSTQPQSVLLDSIYAVLQNFEQNTHKEQLAPPT